MEQYKNQYQMNNPEPELKQAYAYFENAIEMMNKINTTNQYAINMTNMANNTNPTLK